MFPRNSSTSSSSNVRYLRVALIGAGVLSLIIIAGCGYRFSPGGEYIDKKVQTVFIDNFTNKTSEPNVENTIRNSFIDQFIIGGRFKLVDSRDSADAVFKGSVTSIVTSPLTYQRTGITAGERLSVGMELVFEEQDSHKIIWTDKNFTAIQDYTFSDLNTKDTNRTNALTKLANDSAEKAYRLMMSGF